MKIESHSAFKYYDQYFWSFSLMLSNINYFPFIRSYEFSYSENPALTCTDLTVIVPCSPLTGSMQSCTFKEIQQLINDVTQWDVDNQGFPIKITDQALIEARTFIFFDNIMSQFVYSAVNHCFIYKPGPCDYFVDTKLWSFCFVLMTESEGLVFYGKVWSDATLCKPEHEQEAAWRKYFDVL